VSCGVCRAESNSEVLTILFDHFGHPVCSIDCLLIRLVREVASKTFEFVGAVIPKWLALGEEGKESDFVSSCLLAIVVVYLCNRFRLLFDAVFDPVCY
jgi:hypothetical protein